MLDYTRALLNKTVKDVSSAVTVFHFGMQTVYIAYLIYLLLTPNKIWYLHLPLLAISIAFFIYDVISSKAIIAIKNERPNRSGKKLHKQRLFNAKRSKAQVTKIKFYSSHVIKLFVLASAFYPIIVAPDTVHPLSVMCTTVMVLLWILLVILEVAKIMLEARKDMFMEALQADFETVTKPITNLKDTINKVMHKEVEEKPEPSKNRVRLDELVQVYREEKAERKAEAKAKRNEKLSAWLDRHITKLSSKKSSIEPKDDEAADKETTEVNNS